MQNYPFNFEQLYNFSNSNPYEKFDYRLGDLLTLLDENKKRLNFPAVQNDVGNLIKFLHEIKRPKVIFEMGSGYGHSAFWYLAANNNSLTDVYLTEMREDLEREFHALPWPSEFKNKCHYHTADAFDVLKEVREIDFVLIDGVKSDYLAFLEASYERLSADALIVVDNSYWRGSFLDEEFNQKKSAKGIKNLHEFLLETKKFSKVFLPYKDGVSLLRKLPS